MNELHDLHQELLRHGPSPETLVVLLMRMQSEGRYSEVIRECLTALRRYPEHLRLRRLLADAYLRAGFMGQAEDELNKIAAEMDRRASVYKTQGELYARQGRTEKAAEALSRYLSHRPEDAEARILRDGLTKANEPPVQAAVGGTEDMASIRGDTTEEMATPTLAEIYFDQGKLHEAISTYEHVLSRNPGEPDIIDRLEQLKTLAGQQQERAPQTKDHPHGVRQLIKFLQAWLEEIRESDRE